jgi:surface antigen
MIVGALTGEPATPPAVRSRPRLSNAAAVAAINRLIGNRIGSALDDEDRMRAYQAQMQALDNGGPGAPVGWRNEDSGRHGTVVPGPTYQRNSMTCRQFTHTVFIDDKPQVARGTACRNAEGNWISVG